MLFEDCAFEISVADVNDVQESREGVYTQTGSTFNGMPVYRSVSGQYLYKASASNVGWAIGPSTTQAGFRSTVSEKKYKHNSLNQCTNRISFPVQKNLQIGSTILVAGGSRIRRQ